MGYIFVNHPITVNYVVEQFTFCLVQQPIVLLHTQIIQNFCADCSKTLQDTLEQSCYFHNSINLLLQKMQINHKF